MSIEGQGHFFTIYFPGFVCFVLYLDKISGECLQDHWSSGSPLFLMGSFSYLQVMMTYIRAWMSLKFGQIQPRTTELAALKRLKLMFPFFLAFYNGSQVSIVAHWATCFC